MKNKLTSNIGLKIISLLFAFALWMVVNNIDNPTISQSYINVPVKLLNTELITDSGQIYEVLDDTDVVSRVTVWAPRSVINSLSEKNIVATADVSELSSLDTISIKFSTNLYNSEVKQIKGSIDTIKLGIENKRTKTLALKATSSGRTESGYLVGEISTDQNLVRLSGPESVISQISKAVVDVDVTGFTSDIVTNAEIRLYDAEDNLIQDSRITQNIKSVDVKVNIYQTKEVALNYSTTGTPAQGYRASGQIDSNPATVTIAGKSSILNNITAIEISGEALDITGLSENLTTEISLREYLPDNVFLANSSQASAEVTVHIQQETSKRLEIQGDRVSVTNIPEGYRATISELGESFSIEVIGLPGEISELRAADVKGVVDIAAWMEEQEMTEPVEGYYLVEVDFGLSDRVTILEPVTVTLHLSQIEE